MLIKKSTLCMFSVLVIILLVSSTASANSLNAALGTGFTYQGKFTDGSAPAADQQGVSFLQNSVYGNGAYADLTNLFPCTPPPSGMVSWWGGDNNALDMVGGNNGTLMGNATYASGMVGQAFSFDGVDDYVEMPSGVGDFGSNAFTVDYWMYSNNVGSATYIMGKSHPDGGLGWDIRLQDSKIRLEGTDGWDPSYNWESDASATPNSWHHVAVSSTDSLISIYIDGIFKGTTTRSSISPTTNSFRIGYTTNYGGSAFSGRIDEVEIFNRALSATEIAAIYNAGSAGKCRSCTPPPANMVSWWGGDNNALDMVGGHNGTLKGNATYASGMVGQAFSFDGAETNFVEIPDSAELNPSGAFSVDGWFYIDPAAVGNVGEIATLVAKSEGSTNNGWTLYFDDRWSTKILKFGMGTIVEEESAISTADWYHITGVYNPSATPRAILYLNGVNVADSGSWTGTVSPNLLNVRIGAMYWTDSYPYLGNDRLNGKADEVEFFNRALSADEIAAIYNAGSAGKCRSCTPPPANMVSWWNAEGNANDIIGTNNGTLMGGATFAPGKVGQAFSFDGVQTNFVEIPNAPSLNFASTSPLTIYMWAYPTASYPMHIVGKRGTCWDPCTSCNYVIAQDSTNGFAFNSGGLPLLSGQQPLTNQWQHIAVTADGSTFRIYIDGQEKGSVAGTLGGQNIASLVIGGVCTDVGTTFSGRLDELTIVNRALSADEIAAIYNAGSAGTCTSDTIPPTVVSVIRANPNLTNAANVDFTVTFSENVTGVDTADFALTKTGTIAGESVSTVIGGPTVYSVTVNTGSGDGTLRLDVLDDDTIQDPALNSLGGAGISNGDFTTGETYEIDKTAPTVTMSSLSSDPTDALPIVVIVQFSETVTGFSSEDIVTSNSTVSNFVAVDGDTYTFDLTPSAEGLITADIASGVATDLADNGNTMATQFSRAYAPIYNLFVPLIQR